ncbi:MAG: hypothetical protein KIT31_04770 [Deltaproteobacteria bacterium]|nr:hypothetical protein [Deltaproteobacteria bacterium]
MSRPSPLVGFNTSVAHRAATFHIQTEDSGVGHPHVTTHLFADGGRIIATRRTSYAEHVDTPAYPDAVRELIRAQHKAMYLALRRGELDHLLGDVAPDASQAAPPPAPVAPAPPPPPPTRKPTRLATIQYGGAETSLVEIILYQVAPEDDA